MPGEEWNITFDRNAKGKVRILQKVVHGYCTPTDVKTLLGLGISRLVSATTYWRVATIIWNGAQPLEM